LSVTIGDKVGFFVGDFVVGCEVGERVGSLDGFVVVGALAKNKHKKKFRTSLVITPDKSFSVVQCSLLSEKELCFQKQSVGFRKCRTIGKSYGHPKYIYK